MLESRASPKPTDPAGAAPSPATAQNPDPDGAAPPAAPPLLKPESLGIALPRLVGGKRLSKLTALDRRAAVRACSSPTPKTRRPSTKDPAPPMPAEAAPPAPDVLPAPAAASTGNGVDHPCPEDCCADPRPSAQPVQDPNQPLYGRPSPTSSVLCLNSVAAGLAVPDELLVVTAMVNGREAKLLVDSGAQGVFVDTTFAAQDPQYAAMAQSRRVRQANGMVTKSTHGLTATTVKIGAYADKLDFVATPIAGYDCIILGKRWLAETGAVIDWKTNISHPCHVKGDRAPPQDVPIYHVSMATMRKMVRKQQPMFVANVRPAMDDEAATSDPLKPTNTQLSAANQQQLWQVLEQHQDTFKEPDGRREAPDGTQMRIRLQPGSTPPVKRLYRMSAAELQELQKQLADMLEKGWIRPSTSEYGSPVLFAPKPGGGLRLCVDFRALNALTVKDRYPLPRIDMLLDQLEGARYFTSLDLWSGYHQVGLHPEDMHLTAFNTRYGAFEYTVLPFGLANAPSAFMRLMNHTLRRHIDKSCVVYLDDVLIYSRTEEDHIRHVKEVLDTLREARLQVKLSKCSFAQPSTRFLGFRVSAEGISVDPKKVQAVQSWPPPHDLKSTRSYLGFTGFYRRFVPNYAKIAAPLTDLTRTSVPFPATLPEAALSAFRELQDRLTTAPLLVIPRTGPDATFVLHTDASDYGLGAVLLQDQGKGLQPVCYESRKLKASELNYAVHEKELLGVVHGVNAFRHYLEGCKSFTLKTDHHSLRYFLTQRDLSRRQARWSELLSDYSNNMTIEYTPGPTDHADALSRIFALQGGV